YDESSFENFFKSKQTDELIYEYQNYEDKIKKNTSLLLFVKVKNIREFYNNYINKIMKIEEDEYYFRKSVILYTDSGLQNLKYYCTTERIIEYIFSKNEEESIKFEAFECDMFFEDAYFIAMQLVIKLPFISLPHAEKPYESIESKIESQIEKKDLQGNIEKVDSILEIFDSIAKSSDID
ncbi:ABC-three component system middle component 1, partial [Lactococcus formosensis]|uniref:ABC-three component system middle component 1 n=1 Tax=Lactococcus formosensis TaxID=1281486 RepID=UPI00254D184B